jgi:hypothetical protein
MVISREAAMEEARVLMLAFADRTGLTSERPPRRYLWTDAFAICNLLGLARMSGDERFMERALQAVDQVHRVLGRHRVDGSRRGWLSGLDEEDGASHPTRGGLRIGKMLPERGPGEPFDERLEWERDGQYFHYLTKWMHALDQVSRATRQPRFNLWARELAEAAHRAFSSGDVKMGGRRLVWKMSIDLSRPLVRSMGQHDALDGWITSVQLQRTAADLGTESEGPSMIPLAADFATMVAGRDLSTTDALGLGGLLTDAARVAQLMGRGAFSDADLLDSLLAAALEGLPRYAQEDDLRRPASRRLAFRELGLAIGLQAIGFMEKGAHAEYSAVGAPKVRTRLADLAPYLPFASEIQRFWLDAGHRGRTWSEHRDINEVMLATTLIPEGFVALSSLD